MLSIFHANFLDEGEIFIRLDLPQLKLECLNCQKSNIRTKEQIALALVFTLDKFCFLQANQQKRTGMVSTNNITYSE